MRKAIKEYEAIMIRKIFSSKTNFDVLGIIDKKVKLIQQSTNDKTILSRFIDNCLFDLRQVKEKDVAPGDLSKIRAAISHLQNLEMHY